jgi:O-antigen ligase
MSRIKELVPGLRKFFWAFFLLSLPISNFRYFPGSLSGSKIQVRPLLIIPMAFLLLLELPRIWKKKLPRSLLPLLLFVILVTVSSVLPLLQGYTSQLAEASIISRMLRAFITLFLGLAVYLTVSIVPRDQADLDFSLKWLYGGMILAIFWGTLQMLFVLDLIPNWYVIMSEIQQHITINVGSSDRIMGLTLEPSWFADQISALWLPWVLPAVLHNRTVYKKRWGWITIEKILLVWMLAVLVFTLSRAGFAVAAAVCGAGFLLFRYKKPDASPEPERKGWLGALLRFWSRIPRPIRVTALTVLALAGISAGVYFIGKDNKYINRMWLYWVNYSALADTIGTRSLGGFFRYIGFGPRFVYWETALRMFQKYPFFGVGLGNYSFHFLESLPSIQVGYVPELLTRIVPDYVRVTTAKNYLGRLLAETGMVGTGAFLAFLISLGAGGLYLWLSDQPERKFWGAGALLGLFAFLVDSFSYDSLAIPNPWVVFGLISAAVVVYSNSVDDERGKAG